MGTSKQLLLASLFTLFVYLYRVIDNPFWYTQKTIIANCDLKVWVFCSPNLESDILETNMMEGKGIFFFSTFPLQYEEKLISWVTWIWIKGFVL